MQGLFDPIIRAVSSEQIQEHLQAIYENNRFFDFNRFRHTADYLSTALQNYGLQVDRIDIPADGETRYGDAVMPLAWDCESAELELLSPEQRTLVTRDECPTCIGMWSPPTQPDGLEGEVICLSKGEPSELESRDVKGTFLYTPGRIDAIREAAIQKEAVGIISSWSPVPQREDSVQWIFRNSRQPGGWGAQKGDPLLLTFALSPRLGNEIVHLSTQGTVQVRAKVQSRLYGGELPIVSGLIAGESDEGEILLMTPLYGQGAHFNASTVAALLESARLFATQVEAGALPRPYLNMRFLFLPKIYGSIAYAQERKDILAKTKFALNLEAGAGNPDISWSRWSYRCAPIHQRYYADGLARRLFKQYLHHWRPQRHLETRSFSLAADGVFNDPQIGVPTHWLYGGTDEECRHSSLDTPETTDSRSLIDLATAPVAMAYTMASIGIGDIPDLATWNFQLSQERLQDDLQQFIDRTKEAQSLNDFNEILGDASRQIPLRIEMEMQGLTSLADLGEGAEESMDWETVKEFIRALHELGKTVLNVIRSHVNVCADELNLPFTKMEVPADVNEDERIPVRTSRGLGVVTLDALPFEDWTTPVKQSPRNNVPYMMAWWLADGKRNIGQIQRVLQLEANRYRECIPAWFTFLEKHGYVTLKSLPPTGETPDDEGTEPDTPC